MKQPLPATKYEQSHKHHFVPIWYQKRFLAPGKTTLQVLRLFPDRFRRADGSTCAPRAVEPKPPASVFWEPNLYDVNLPGLPADTVEKRWFGDIDTNGSRALSALIANDSKVWHPRQGQFFEYLDAQRLRTPRGLSFLKEIFGAGANDQHTLMSILLNLTNMHTTMWVEGAIEIFEAADQQTRFIFTDSPVTFFNRHFGPLEARRGQDPQFHWKGTQTLFPLDSRRLLVLTHLEGIRPLARGVARSPRTNSRLQAPTIARTDKCVRGRSLTQEQVCEVNYLLKMAAYRFLASQEEIDLYPEKHMKLRGWGELGEFLYPEHEGGHGGDIFVRYRDGSVYFQDRFGRVPATEEDRLSRAAEAEARREKMLQALADLRKNPLGKK